jgi:putative ABC transport system ATP-binding protein
LLRSTGAYDRAVLFALRDIHLSRDGREVLRGVTTEIAAGSTAIVGPSGSGKSTLLRVLNRLADPDAGVVHYRGRPITDHDPPALRRDVALVPQLPALLEGTVGDNIAFAARLAGQDPEPDACLNRAGLDSSYADRDAAALSVGEQQRAMLARALIQQPSVLLLDEPTSALDGAAREAVEATLGGLRAERDVSLVLVTHDPAQAARLADRTLSIDAGRIAGA